MNPQLRYTFTIVALIFAGAVLLVLVTPVDRGLQKGDDPKEETVRLLTIMGMEDIEIYEEDTQSVDGSCDDFPGHSPVRFSYYAVKDGVAVEGTACGADIEDSDNWAFWEAKESPHEKIKEVLGGYGYNDINVYGTTEGVCQDGNVIYLFRAVSPNGKNVEGTACGYDPQNYKIWEK